MKVVFNYHKENALAFIEWCEEYNVERGEVDYGDITWNMTHFDLDFMRQRCHLDRIIHHSHLRIDLPQHCDQVWFMLRFNATVVAQK